MNAYDLIQDLYKFEDKEVCLVEERFSYIIDNIFYNGYKIIKDSKEYFIYRLKSSDGNNRTMGNLWSAYDLKNNKVFISGMKTKRDIINTLKIN